MEPEPGALRWRYSRPRRGDPNDGVAGTVSLPASRVDPLPMFSPPAPCRLEMTVAAPRVNPVSHPFAGREGRKGQPFSAFGAASVSLRPDPMKGASPSRESLFRGLLAQGRSGCVPVVTPPPIPLS